MRFNRWYLILAAVVIFSLALAALLSFTRYNRRERLARFTSEARGIIIGTDLTNYRTANAARERTDAIIDEQAGKRRRTTHIRFAYEANGTRFESETFRRGDQREDFPGGATVRVCFDPQHPFEAVIVEPEERCGR